MTASIDTQTSSYINPMPFLKYLKGKRVLVTLKWEPSFVGYLVSTDGYMNVELSQAEEYKFGAMIGFVGDCFIRCNNIKTIEEFIEPNEVENGAKNELDE